jgi:hypothetical protein
MKRASLSILRLVLSCCLLSVLAACEEESSIEFNDVPVVEGYLYTGSPVELKISRKSPFSSDLNLDPKDLDNPSVQIKNGGQTYALSPQGEGRYLSTGNNLQIKTGETYQLEFEFKGKKVSAETTVLSKPQGFKQDVTSIKIARFTFPPSGNLSFPDPVKFSWINPDQTYYLLVVENLESSLDPIIDIDFGDEEPPRLFRIEPTQNNNYEVRSQQFQYYGRHRIILYHINPEYALLYQDSGDNSLNLKTPPTNVKNGMGIFTAISSDTLYLNVIE